MEVLQGNSLCSHLKQAKTVIFFLLQNQRTRGQNRSVMPGKVDTTGREEEVEKGCRRVNMVQILCTLYINGKNDTC
jgi:hypothetical protein